MATTDRTHDQAVIELLRQDPTFAADYIAAALEGADLTERAARLLIKENKRMGYVVHRGTREELTAAGLATDEMFPDPTKRDGRGFERNRKGLFQGDKVWRSWRVSDQRDGTFELGRRRHLAADGNPQWKSTLRPPPGVVNPPYCWREVPDESMDDASRDISERYPKGTFIFCDPYEAPRDGDAVIVRRSEAESRLFRKLMREGERWLLVPLNPAYADAVTPLESLNQVEAVVTMSGWSRLL